MLHRVGRRSVLAVLVCLLLPAQASAAQAHQAVARHAHLRHTDARQMERQAEARRPDAIKAMLADPAHTAPVGEVARVPYGWADFCTRQPQECRVDVADAVDIVMSERILRTLRAVNARANADIEPISNFDHWGTLLDHWDYPSDGKGDCKIYALWKRKLLLDMGFPRQALLMTIVRDLEGNGHTILTVKTDKGDYILDNMVGEIRLWDETGYRFVKRQSQNDPNVWVSIGPATAMPVTTAGVN